MLRTMIRWVDDTNCIKSCWGKGRAVSCTSATPLVLYSKVWSAAVLCPAADYFIATLWSGSKFGNLWTWYYATLWPPQQHLSSANTGGQDPCWLLHHNRIDIITALFSRLGARNKLGLSTAVTTETSCHSCYHPDWQLLQLLFSFVLLENSFVLKV